MSLPDPSAKRIAILAPMPPELRAVVAAGRLTRTVGDAVFSHTGKVGTWTVMAGRTGIGPISAGQATAKVLAAGSFEHVMVVGVAGGLDPRLPIGALIVPSQVRLYPDGPIYETHPLPPRRSEGWLMTTDGLLADQHLWRPLLTLGFAALDMEAAGVAEVCAEAGVSWSVYRGISDRPEEGLIDHRILELSKSDGSPDLVAVSKYLARDPRRAKILVQLKRRVDYAAAVAARAAVADLAGDQARL